MNEKNPLEFNICEEEFDLKTLIKEHRQEEHEMDDCDIVKGGIFCPGHSVPLQSCSQV